MIEENLYLEGSTIHLPYDVILISEVDLWSTLFPERAQPMTLQVRGPFCWSGPVARHLSPFRRPAPLASDLWCLTLQVNLSSLPVPLHPWTHRKGSHTGVLWQTQNEQNQGQEIIILSDTTVGNFTLKSYSNQKENLSGGGQKVDMSQNVNKSCEIARPSPWSKASLW